VVRIVDTRRCYFVCNLEAQTGLALTLEQPIRLEIEVGKSKVLRSGKINFISPVVDPASGLLKVKAVWENPDGKIRPGVAATMHLTTPADGK
jgi:multidrug efflux pump subunit AcrA (membrane-fusion protein)